MTVEAMQATFDTVLRESGGFCQCDKDDCGAHKPYSACFEKLAPNGWYPKRVNEHDPDDISAKNSLALCPGAVSGRTPSPAVGSPFTSSTIIGIAHGSSVIEPTALRS